MSFETKIALSAAIGGTAEALGGGKFANGAVTGAYVMMFNHLQDKIQEMKEENKYKNLIHKADLSRLTTEEREAFFKNCREYLKNGFEYLSHEAFISQFGDYDLTLISATLSFPVNIALLFANLPVGLSYTIGSSNFYLQQAFNGEVISTYNSQNGAGNFIGVFVKREFVTERSHYTRVFSHFYNPISGEKIGVIIQ